MGMADTLDRESQARMHQGFGNVVGDPRALNPKSYANHASTHQSSTSEMRRGSAPHTIGKGSVRGNRVKTSQRNFLSPIHNTGL